MTAQHWPLERLDSLRHLAAEGLSAAQIGQRLNITRDAVIGKCRREDIPMLAVWSVWTEDKITEFRRLWIAGSTTMEIARVFGTTRKAIREKARKLNLPSRASTPVRKKKAAVKNKTVFHALTGTPYEVADIDVPISERDLAIPHAQRRTLFQLKSSSCRWPVGDPTSADFFFCGADAARAHPYCVQHCRRAYA